MSEHTDSYIDGLRDSLGLVELLPALNTYHVANVSSPVQLDEYVKTLLDRYIVDNKDDEITDKLRFASNYNTDEFCKLMRRPKFQAWAIEREQTAQTWTENKMLDELREALVTWIGQHTLSNDAPMHRKIDVYKYIVLRYTLRGEHRNDPTKYERGIRKRYKQDVVEEFGNLEQTTYLQDLFTGVNLLCKAEDAGPCPNLDRPPGKNAMPPCVRRGLTG